MTIDQLLAAARSRLERVPVTTDGLIAGALFHPRNVLEWLPVLAAA